VVSDGSEENGTEESKSGTDKGGSKDAKIVVKEERNYSLSVNGRLKLMSLSTDGEKLTIPESIELDGMVRVVKSIGKNALKGNKTVREVVIGKDVTTICTGAFKNCRNLELIELTGSVKKIYKNAFKGIAKNARFVIEASEEDFARIVELLKASGVSDTVTFERI
ncbi:MAG: leucine-rich repeat domain-containing protein, partial [Lachnospiraceae bacterium]|nr:leucine-rich repeat domain-containing protein [Lachnospiraceae bacterium]